MAALRSAAARAVHLKVYPRPASLSESRELLSVLQQFGEVTMFKSLRYDYVQPAPNTCLAIYRDATSASKLLKASPLRFTLEPISGDHTGDLHDQTPDPAREDGFASALGSNADQRVADVIDDAEFDITDGPSKPGADEMIRPSTLLFQTIESFSRPHETAQPPQETLSNDVSDATESDANSASSDAELVAQTERDNADPEQQPVSEPVVHVKHVPAPQSPCEFHVVADVSEMNHRDYIERSFWYGPYIPRKRTASYIDLTARGVTPAIADVYMHKPEQPLRIVQGLRADVSTLPTLRQIWEQGEAQRAKSSGSSSAASLEELR